MRWQSEITAWDPPHRFVDEQRQGPYKFWLHEHRFRERDGGTWVGDNVRYGVPFGALVHRLFVRRDVRRIFRYRTAQMHRLFGDDAPLASDKLILLDSDGISITAKGRLLLRCIAMVFDRHLAEIDTDKRFSRAI